ncbi:MAG: hypothetical protein ACR2HJ_10600 [Fimbriimonadales bacterium]
MLRIAAIASSLVGLLFACRFLWDQLAATFSPPKPEFFAAGRLSEFAYLVPYVVLPIACPAALLLVDRARRRAASKRNGSVTGTKPNTGRFAIGAVASVAIVALLVIVAAFIFPTGEGERVMFLGGKRIERGQ